CYPFHLSSGWSRHIGVIVAHIGGVNDGRLVVYLSDISSRNIIMINIAADHSLLWNENPILGRNINRYMNTYSRHYRRPAIVVPPGSPIPPGWSPFVAWNPSPPQIIIEIPSSIVERCPTPFIIGYPRISIG